MGRALQALKVRNFRLYFGGQVLSNVGTWFQNLAQALLVLHLTHSAASLGIVSALQFAPLLIFGAPVGVLLDRVDPRRVLMATSLGACLLAVGLGVVTRSGHVTRQWIYGFWLALGFVQAFDRPAGQSFLVELVDAVNELLGSGTYGYLDRMGVGAAAARQAFLAA